MKHSGHCLSLTDGSSCTGNLRLYDTASTFSYFHPSLYHFSVARYTKILSPFALYYSFLVEGVLPSSLISVHSRRPTSQSWIHYLCSFQKLSIHKSYYLLSYFPSYLRFIFFDGTTSSSLYSAAASLATSSSDSTLLYVSVGISNGASSS